MRRIVASFLLSLALTVSAQAQTDMFGVGQALEFQREQQQESGTLSSSSQQVPVIDATPDTTAVMLPPSAAANAQSEVFGANLFTGAFSQQGSIQFNQDYLISIGDKLQVRLWGGFTFDAVLTVDPQGNIFLPHVGPVKVMGVANKNLQRTVDSAVRRVFRANVSSYASLAAAQPVRVFVGGFVYRPGLYNGTSMDSLLHYLDQAGGIDPERGSFLNVQVKRGQAVRSRVNLYDFLLSGEIPLLQLADGDVIFISPRQSTVLVRGLAANQNRFEFSSPTLTINDLMKMAKPEARATHVRVSRQTGTVLNTEYYSLANAGVVAINNGDIVEFTADKKPGTITVRVEGEHDSPQEYVLPYGSSLSALLSQIRLSERSDPASIQLYRKSVQERQIAMLNTALKSLESSVLTARSGTSDEARLRKDEAELILQWVDRARKVEPSGQVLISESGLKSDMTLENGDIINIPAKDNLVLVSGEVLFPNAIAYDPRMTLADYIGKAGGYTQNADNSRIIIAHRNGAYEEGNPKLMLKAGDEVLVLPKISVKQRQIWKDMTQIIYQIAVSAKVVFGL